MGLFDIFKKKDKPAQEQKTASVQKSAPVSESEKKYYQEDSYYMEKAFEGTVFEKKVVTFEERKKTAIPSSRGLYPAEILLLDYCSKGTYPGSKNGYPGFWWFEYGIRDVAAALRKLESEGYIELASPKNSVKGFTVAQLKELLEANGQSIAGKKADLVERAAETLSDDVLLKAGVQQKYALTDLGRLELEENAYVPYMHSYHGKTTEDDRFGMTFNVWSINKLLGFGDKSNWRAIVDQQE